MDMETLLDQMPETAFLFAGDIPEAVEKSAEKRGIKVYDMMRDEFTAVKNAAAAAEGAAAEAIVRSPVSLTKSRCLILGYGRCGRR